MRRAAPHLRQQGGHTTASKLHHGLGHREEAARARAEEGEQSSRRAQRRPTRRPRAEAEKAEPARAGRDGQASTAANGTTDEGTASGARAPPPLGGRVQISEFTKVNSCLRISESISYLNFSGKFTAVLQTPLKERSEI